MGASNQKTTIKIFEISELNTIYIYMYLYIYV